MARRAAPPAERKRAAPPETEDVDIAKAQEVLLRRRREAGFPAVNVATPRAATGERRRAALQEEQLTAALDAAPRSAIGTCDCGGELPCFGRGLSRAGAELLAVIAPAEVARRMQAHVLALAREAGPAGITHYEAAQRLGLDPLPESRTARIRHPHFATRLPSAEHAVSAASRGLRPGRIAGR